MSKENAEWHETEFEEIKLESIRFRRGMQPPLGARKDKNLLAESSPSFQQIKDLLQLIIMERVAQTIHHVGGIPLH